MLTVNIQTISEPGKIALQTVTAVSEEAAPQVWMSLPVTLLKQNEVGSPTNHKKYSFPLVLQFNFLICIQ